MFQQSCVVRGTPLPLCISTWHTVSFSPIYMVRIVVYFCVGCFATDVVAQHTHMVNGNIANLLLYIRKYENYLTRVQSFRSLFCDSTHTFDETCTE